MSPFVLQSTRAFYTPCKISRGIKNQGKSDPRPSRLTTKDSGYLHRCAACDSQSVLPTLTFGGNCSSQKRRRRRNKKERHFLEVLHVFAHATRKIYMTRKAAGKKEERKRSGRVESTPLSTLPNSRKKAVPPGLGSIKEGAVKLRTAVHCTLL